MPAQKGLGKGLGALFGDMSPAVQGESPNLQLPIQKIEPNPLQPRKNFDEEELQALADSIGQHGVLQPLAVRRRENGFYQIIAGERRWRAARLAGLTEIPAVVLDVDDKTAAELALIENLQRQDLNPVEEAMGYRRLLDEYGMTQEQAAERVGKSRPAVANALRLLTLPEEILTLLAQGKLSAGHARAVLTLKEPEKQLAAAQKIYALELSVRQAELMCRSMSKEKAEKPPKEVLEVDYIAECEQSLSRRLGRGVKIINGKRKGHLDLEFYGPDDLQQLLDLLEQLRHKED
ncbi:MAG: ParB/RepB/Spo0J family partition protein [Oscillospiraceae bacterium]|nr:ParB/RepB/Spo0J family partition protein [Oscillospiraceae bacterium]